MKWFSILLLVAIFAIPPCGELVNPDPTPTPSSTLWKEITPPQALAQGPGWQQQSVVGGRQWCRTGYRCYQSNVYRNVYKLVPQYNFPAQTNPYYYRRPPARVRR